MDGKLWGGFTEDSSNFTSPYLLSFDEVEKLSKDLVQPSLGKAIKPENVITTQLMPMSFFETDPIVQNNINLVQYSKKLQETLTQLETSYKKVSLESLPPLPPKPQKYHSHKDCSVKLTRKGTCLLLHKAVYQICAHEGFDHAHDSVLSTLVDVADEMLSKICKLLKVNTERELLKQSTGFVDPMERTLHDIGLNGVKDLHSFYSNRVLGYNDRLHLQARNLRQMYANAIIKMEHNRTSDMTWEEHESGESSGNEISECDRSFKREYAFQPPVDELSSNNDGINQLHLEDNATVGPGLEPGLRMLYTLEQQEALSANSQGIQYLTSEDGISPSQFSGLEASPGVAASSKNCGKKKKKY